jgi:hypothetical protein
MEKIMADTKPTLAQFEPHILARMTPQQKSDAAAQLMEAGFPVDQVTAAGLERDLNLTPTEGMIARKEQAAFLRANWTGDKTALEVALKKAGL